MPGPQRTVHVLSQRIKGRQKKRQNKFSRYIQMLFLKLMTAYPYFTYIDNYSYINLILMIISIVLAILLLNLEYRIDKYDKKNKSLILFIYYLAVIFGFIIIQILMWFIFINAPGGVLIIWSGISGFMIIRSIKLLKKMKIRCKKYHNQNDLKNTTTFCSKYKKICNNPLCKFNILPYFTFIFMVICILYILHVSYLFIKNKYIWATIVLLIRYFLYFGIGIGLGFIKK